MIMTVLDTKFFDLGINLLITIDHMCTNKQNNAGMILFLYFYL